MIRLYVKVKKYFPKSTQVQIIICTCVLFGNNIGHPLHHNRVLVKHLIEGASAYHYTTATLLPSC